MDALKILSHQRSHIQSIYKSTLNLYNNGTKNQKRNAKKKLKDLENKIEILDKIEGEVLFDEYI